MIEPGAIVDNRFEVLELIGEGGLAHVYKVRHVALGSVHALKLLSWRKKRLAERLLLEGRIQAQLNHPNIVAVTDIVRHDGQFGLLMEYVPNETLESWLASRGGLGVAGGLELFAPILAAVSAAHDAGVLHRDLKPANVLLSIGARGVVPKVTDFGIAKVVADMADEGSTAVGSTMGTPGYIAPEQVSDSSTLDARADVFALGAIAWEMITGARAFGDENGRVTVNSTVQNTPRPLTYYLPEAPLHVDRALARAMARDPKDRFTDCRAFARALYAESPTLLGLVEGQSLTGTLSLSGVREALERSLSDSGGRSPTLSPPTGIEADVGVAASTQPPGPAPATSPPSQPTLSVTQDTPPGVDVVSGGMSMFAVATAFGLAIGGMVVLGVLAAIGSHLMMPPPDAGPVGPIATVPIAVPTPSIRPAPAPTDGVVEVPPEPGQVEPAPVPAVPEPVRPNPDGAVGRPSPALLPPEPSPVPEPVQPEPVQPEPVQPEPVQPEPSPVPEPVQPEPVQPEPVQPEVVPVLQPAPAPTLAPSPVAAPSAAGMWTGTANKLPFTLDIAQTGTQLRGRAVFGGFQAREESITGTVSPDGAVRFQAADLAFTGQLAGDRLTGTYQAGRGKELDWSVTR